MLCAATASVAIFFSITLRNAMYTSSFIIRLHNSQNSSINTDPYRVFHNLIVFLLYCRHVQTSVGSPNFPSRFPYENNEMEECLHCTVLYTCAYVGANIWKNIIICVFSFYVFYYAFQRLVLSSYLRFPPDIQMFLCPVFCLLLSYLTSNISVYLHFQ